MTSTAKKRQRVQEEHVDLGIWDTLDRMHLHQVINTFKELEKEYFDKYGPTTSCVLSRDTEYGMYGDPDTQILSLIVEREENDKEYAKRMETTKKRRAAAKKAAAARRKTTEEWERKKLKELLKKYPPTTT